MSYNAAESYSMLYMYVHAIQWYITWWYKLNVIMIYGHVSELPPFGSRTVCSEALENWNHSSIAYNAMILLHIPSSIR